MFLSPGAGAVACAGVCDKAAPGRNVSASRAATADLCIRFSSLSLQMRLRLQAYQPGSINRSGARFAAVRNKVLGSSCALCRTRMAQVREDIMALSKREFIAAGLSFTATAALAQDDLGRTGEAAPPKLPPLRKAKTTKLFLSPAGWPNAITADPTRGFWVQEQRHDNKPEAAWLL